MKTRSLITLFALVALSVLLTSSVYAANNVDFKQCANDNISGVPAGPCDFVGGSSQGVKADWWDGMAVPQRVMWNNIAATTGNVHTLGFGTEWTKGGKHSYDFLVSWNQAKQLSSLIAGLNMTIGYDGGTGDDPCYKVSNSGQSPTDYEVCRSIHGLTPQYAGYSSYSATYTMPDTDSFTSTNCDPGQCLASDKQAALSSIFGGRTFTIWANQPITVNSFTFAHYNDKNCAVPVSSDAGDTFVCYLINYTSSATVVDLEVAPHIALGCDINQPTSLYWGCPFGGASVISGNPYHFFNTTGVDGATASLDNQIQVSNTPPTGKMNTSVQATAITIGQRITDTVTITGTTPLAGSIGFFVCGPTLSAQPCIAGTQVGVTTTISGSPSTVSAGFVPSQNNWYCFRVSFVSSNTSNESTNSWTTSGSPFGECANVAQTTAVTLSSFKVPEVDQGRVILNWTTASEINTAGFNIYRSDSKDGPWTRINPQIIPSASEKVMGGKYRYEDTTTQSGKTYYYQLEDVEFNGTKVTHNPVVVAVPDSSTSAGNWTFVGLLFAGFIIIGGGVFAFLKKRNVF